MYTSITSFKAFEDRPQVRFSCATSTRVSDRCICTRDDNVLKRLVGVDVLMDERWSH